MTNPLTLVHIVDEHELDPDVATVGRLEKSNKQEGQSDTVNPLRGRTRVDKDTQTRNTSSLRMISLRGRVVSPPPMKVVGGS